jgi:hypothetical protein
VRETEKMQCSMLIISGFYLMAAWFGVGDRCMLYKHIQPAVQTTYSMFLVDYVIASVR